VVNDPTQIVNPMWYQQHTESLWNKWTLEQILPNKYVYISNKNRPITLVYFSIRVQRSLVLIFVSRLQTLFPDSNQIRSRSFHTAEASRWTEESDSRRKYKRKMFAVKKQSCPAHAMQALSGRGDISRIARFYCFEITFIVRDQDFL
jgi:hypothetical protein